MGAPALFGWLWIVNSALLSLDTEYSKHVGRAEISDASFIEAPGSLYNLCLYLDLPLNPVGLMLHQKGMLDDRLISNMAVSAYRDRRTPT